MAGLIDWHLIQEMSFRNGGQDSSVKGNEMWSNAAPMYHFMSGLEQKYTLRQVDEMTLDQNDTVLDIGCGIGRLSVPVAQRVRAVTSIDIADGMLEYCRRNASVAELTNVTVQKLDWKKAQIGIDIQTHDVAFASRSVGMRDIVKLNKVARKYAFLLSFAGYPSLRHVYIELLDGLREKKHNGAAHLGPRWRTFGYNVAFNILYDMGIDPTVKVITDGFERIYGSREEAYDDLRFVAREIHPDGRLTDEQESIFRKNVDLYLSKEPNDTWRFLRNTKTYIIGWEPKNWIDAMDIFVFKISGKALRWAAVPVLTALLFLSLAVTGVARNPSPESVLDHMVKAIDNSADIGQKANRWSQKKQQLLEQLRELELKNQWTQFQIERHRTWVENEIRAVCLLEERLAQVEKVRVALDPLIEVLYAQLEEAVQTDLPFLKEERRRRLSFLRQELDKTKKGLGHRLGRLLEALQVEALYGQHLDVKEVVAVIDGVQHQVTTFLLGRLALFRISQDNRLVQRFDKKNNAWMTIPAENARELRKAIDITTKKRVTAVVELPVGTLSSLLPRSVSNKDSTAGDGQ